jgi:signal peptidase I
MTEYDDYEASSALEEEPAREKDSFGRWLIETALLVGLAFILAQGIKTFIVQPFVIPTGSMIPTIEINDRVIAEKLTYRFSHGPEPRDIVVFDDPTGENPQLIKRVIAVGGQTVDVKNDSVYVDGKKLDEPYVHGKPTVPLSDDVTFPLTVDEGYFFPMGDNRTDSSDGRVFGQQPITKVRGRGIWTYWPLSRFGPLE